MMSSSELRKVNKPLVERRRRERINGCLDELKTLLVNNNKQFQRLSRSSKLEKVDILELAVQQIRSMQQQNLTTVPEPYRDVSLRVNQSYAAGYSAAAEHTKQFILSDPLMNSEVKQQLLNTLTHRGCFTTGSDVNMNSTQRHSHSNNIRSDININRNANFGSQNYEVGSYSNPALALTNDMLRSDTIGGVRCLGADNVFSFGQENSRTEPRRTEREVRHGKNRVHRPTALKRRAFGPLDNMQHPAPSATATLATLKLLEPESLCDGKRTNFADHLEMSASRQLGTYSIDYKPNTLSVKNLKSDSEINYLTSTKNLSQFAAVDSVGALSSPVEESNSSCLNRIDVNPQNCYSPGSIQIAIRNNLGQVVPAQSPSQDQRNPALAQNVWRPW